MSGIPEFLKFLNKLNFTLELKDGKLTLQAFKNRVTREEISAIKQNQEVVGYINENKQALIEYLSGKAQVELVHISNPDTIPLTFAQEGLWFIDRLQGSQQYHIPTILELKGNVNAEALEYAFKNCVKRHQVLRTVIENFDGIPSQKVLSAEAWRLQVLDALDMQSNTENLINQPFDLSKDFMLRAHLIRLSENAHELLITLHHIAADGWSLNILIKEVQELYRRYIQGDKTPLADLPIQFADFAIWQRSNLVNEPLNNLKSYWKEALSNTEPIEVPLDFPRPKIQSTRGAISYFKIDKTLADRIDELSRKYEVTRFVAFLSAYQILLNIYSGQRNFCIGTPTAGRFEKATEPLIGFFINTLALPCELDIEKSYVELLKRNKFTVLDAFEHQQIPFEKVVETVVGQRNLERSPIFQVMFSFQNVSETSNSEIGDLSLARKIPKHTTARYELTLNISESNKGFNASFEYCTELFVESSIVRMQTHFHHLLHQIVTNPDKQLSQYELLSVDEQQALLKSFGSVKQSYDQSQTLISLFEQQVTRSPKSIALVFNDREITYEALEAQGNQLAWYLLENQIKPGELIAVSMERSAEMIVALMGILKAGAAYVPIDPNYPATRKAYMLKDTSVRFVITETSLEAENCITIKPISQWETINGYPKTKPKVKPKPEDLAYVIYTSGSTGNPKGVMVEHQSVVNLILTQRAYFGIDETERILQFSNLSFDASVEQIFLALTSGARLVLFEEGLQLNPTVFELFVTEKGITHLHATPGFIETLNLKQPNSLRRIIAGGDWCKAELANKYKEGLDFYNEYGPTETTVTAIEYKAESQNQSLPIGKGLANTEVYVLSESQKLQPVGVPGEIYLSGVQVARGYLNNEAQTKERFLMDPFNQGQRMYRTGDIGRWLADGNLEYLGRKDQQVKIRGYRIELGEIEAAIESISTIKQSAVLAKTDALGNKRLVAYVVKDQGYAKEQSIVELKQRLPEYMVPQIWVELETIPLTTNGKVDHKALPDPDMEGQKQAQYAAPRTQIEHDLVEIWQDLLGIKQIGIYDNFFELGGHSLLVMRIIASVRQKMGVELTVVGVFENPKICELAIYIESVERVNVLPPILTKVRPKFIPLSFAQERLWFIDQLEGSRHFHIPIVLRFNGNINENALAASFHYLINRHEILRTTIYQVDGVAFQKVNETGAWSLLQINAQDNSEHELQIKLREMAYRPFNLETDFMIRVALFHLKNQESLLALTMHHIVSDGWSTSILVDELKYLYETFSENRLPELQPLPVQYADFAIWQRTYLQEEVLQRRVTFWKNTLADVSPLQLPTDFPRPAIQTFNGAVVGHKISKHLLQDLKGIGTQVESTLFMTLLSAFNILIYRYTNQKTICIGTPVAGRQQKELEPLIGFFINTLALKNVLDCNQTFLDFLQRVKANTLLALEHQDLPFEKVVEALELPRDLSRSPLFQVFFVLQNTPDVSALSLKDVTAKREAFERQTAQYELTLNLSETMDGLHVSAEYNTDLFLKSSIERLLKQFDTLLSAIVKNPNDALDAFEIVEPFELNQLISEFNNTQSVYPERATLVSLFESQVNKTPDHTALSMGDSSLSYCELNVRSNRVAHYLLSLGVGKGSQVPVCLPRGLDLWIAFLGILKAGGSYVPIDPEYPEQRMAYMLEDCGATFWLGDDNLPALKNGINLFKEANHIESFSESNPLQTLLPSDLAYCVYTSGSTGKPKGVMVKHEALVNLVNWHNKRYEVSAQSKSTSMAGVGFDALGWEVWPYLMAGACVEILTNQQRLSPKTIVELIENKGITHSYISTALVGEMAERMRHKPTNLQYMTTAGDQLLSMDIEGLDYKLVNNYGPTEFTICASSYQLTERDKTALPLIGKPIDNTQIYLLSEGGKLCPIGVPGELYLGGMGLAKGYINNPGLTEEKFVRNPFDSQSYVYRTGDLGRWLPDGNLEFLGRIDDQVKIRGYRIELGEIENVLQGMEGISQAVVMARTDKAGTKRLVAYLVTNEGFDKEKAMEGLKAQLPEYMLPQFWVELQELPLTPNGKIDKKALPEPDVIESLQTIYEAPRNATEKVLVEIWEEVLGVSPIGIHDNFFELGGHSILIMRIISLVRIRLDIELSVMLVFKNPSIAQCSEIVRSQINELRLPSIFKADRESRIPLSFAQERLWFIHKLEGSTQYHIPAVLKLVGDLNFQALEESLKQVINRHEILRTTIHEEDGQGYQRINAPDKWRMDWIDAKNETDSELNQRIDDLVNRPFKFEADPMLRAAIIEKGKHEFLLVVTLHHIAADGWSISIVVNEMVSLYKAFITKQSSNLQELHIQYADYAIWQKSYLKGDLLSEKLKYWTQKLSNPEPLNLLTDFPRKLRQINQGATTSLKADNSLLISLKALSQTRGMTLFMTLLAGFKALLYRYTNQGDITIGTTVAGRQQRELEPLIGFFINTLALRDNIEADDNFESLLEKVKTTVLDALEHQDLPFEKVVDAVVKEREVGRSPLFQVLFSFHNIPEIPPLELPGITISNERSRNTTSQFDIICNVTELSDGIQFSMQYNTGLYRQATIHCLLTHYVSLLSEVAERPSQKITAVTYVSQGEITELTSKFNPEKPLSIPYDTIITSIQEVVVKHSKELAFIHGNESIRFEDLNKRSNQLANWLIEKGLSNETPVAVCLDRSIDMMIAILGVLKAGATYVPVDSNSPSERLKYIVEDSGVRIIITKGELPGLTSINRVEVFDFEKESKTLDKFGEANPDLEILPNHCAYIIYTSGSTGKPKGVIVEHGSLMAYLYNGKTNYMQKAGKQTGSFIHLANTFDASLTALFLPLLNGKTAILGSGDAIEVFNDPNFLKYAPYDFLKITPAHLELLRTIFENSPKALTSKLVIGGEALKLSQWAYLKNLEYAIDIINEYGPTEATVGCISHSINTHTFQEAEGELPIGKPFDGVKIFILDISKQWVPIGVAGELYISGRQVARGYLNNLELTKERFLDTGIFEGSAYKLYKTGDLARWLPDGNIEFFGRTDEQIKIRGHRIEPGEIESAVKSLENITDCLVIAKPDQNGTNNLVAYIVSKTGFNKTEAIESLRKILPEYMFPLYWVELEQLPLNSSGKVDKKQLPEPNSQATLQEGYVLPQTQTQKALATIWCDLLEIDEIGIYDNFFDIGGHSLLAIRLIASLRKEFDVEMPILMVFDHPTIFSQESVLNELKKGDVLPQIKAMPWPERIPLSFSQERLWFIDKLEGTRAYHLPSVLKLKGNLDTNILEKSIQAIVDRHSVLRTVYLQENGVAYQSVNPKDLWQLQTMNGTSVSPDKLNETIREFVDQPFDLAKDPMVRALLVKTGKDEYVLAVTLHHIASDGWSTSILVKELVANYQAFSQGKEPEHAPLAVQYADYAIWQRTYLQGDLLAKKLEYWKTKLASPQALELQTDYPRAAMQSNKGAVVSVKTDKQLSQAIEEMSHANGSTVFMSLLAAFKVLLYRYTGQTDIVVGTPMAGRQQQELEPLIGFFINTLALRDELNLEQTFNEVLQQVKQTTLEAYQHQDVPFEKIVDAVVKERDLSRSPLFQVMFVFQNTPEVPKLQLGDIELSRESSEHITAQFELTLSVSESKSGLNLSLSYRTDLFSEQTVKQILIHFHSILHQIVSNPEKPVGEYRLLGEKQEQELLRSNASIERSYDNKQTLVSLFSQRVLQSPKAIALEFKDRQITYEALEAQSNQLAWYLLDQKVKPRELIAISMERSPEMIVGLMGILKAGAAYVPIDPNYPALRKAYMLKDSKARFVITETPVETENCKAIKPISGREELKHYPTTNPAIEIKPEDLAYVIYTSGSTGTPKGVMVEHQSVVNLICAQSEYFKIDETERILQFSNLSFDASVEQIFLALSAGGTLVLFEEGLQLKSGVFEQFITEKGITHFHATPGFIETLNITQPNSLRRIIAGGDWCKAELANKYQGKYDFYNEYGPTETTVTALIYKAENQIRSLPIGKGLANTNVYVLSETQNLQPLGVPGEIYISGIQVARGYLNRKEQSEAVFLNDPFKQGQRMYRTGDMGRWLADGNLEYLGRKDEQVKIRGYRIELGEIETAIERLPTVKQSAVLAKADAQGHKRLVAYVVKQEGYSKEQSVASLKQSLPEYMVPQIWVEVEQIALTANGKVDRKTLPEPDMEGQIQSQYAPAGTQTEQDLVGIWQELLGIKRIGIYDNFFELGGDSILTIQLVSRASKKGYQLQPKDIFIHQKIASLAEWLEIGRNQISMAEQGLLEGVFNLLPIQYDFFNRGIKQASHYNQSLLLAIDKRVSSDKIGASLKSLVNQHDALRLKFINQEGQWMQTYTLAEPELLIEDLSTISEANLSKKVTERAAYYQKTLAIEKGMVFQAVWMKMPDSESHNRLLLIAHHLVVDGVSWRIILEDLETLISAHNSNQVSELGPKTTSYRQWAEALVKYGQTPEIKAQKTYWDNACSLHTALPTDFETQEALLLEHLSNHAVNLNASLTEQLLQQVPKAYQTEINDILLASLVLTITNWTKASALRIGLEGHGRESFDDEINTSRTVGWFTTLYPVLLECDSKNPGNLIKSVKEQLRQIPNKGLGYGILKYLQKESVLQSDNPWDLVFNYFGQLDGVAKKGNWLTGAKESTGLNSDSENEIQDKLTINSRVQNGKLSLSWTFSRLHFKKETIEQLASKYIENLEALIQHCVNIQEIQKTPSDYGLQAFVNYREFDAFLQQQWGDDSLYIQIESVYPLSALQQGMLFHSLYDENGHAYMERFSWELQNINQAYFEQSWELVLQNHSILRSAFFQGVFKIPVQAVFKKVPLPIQWLDYRHLNEKDQTKAIKTFETNDSALPFDFESAPLMRIAVIRISDQRYKMIWTSHHILFDGWSIPVLNDEFLSIYQSLQNQIPLGESKVDYYEDYIRYIAQKNKWKEQDFWQTFLSDLEEPTLLPWIHNSSKRNKGEGRYESKSIKINSSLTQQAQLFAQGKRITMNTLIQGVWSKLLHHFTGNNTVVYGVVVSGRPDDLINVEKKVGLFINTLPHRTNFSAEISIQDYLQTIQDEQLKAREYQYSSLSEIQAFTSVSGDLFDTLVVFENYPVSKVIASDKEGLSVDKVKVEEHTNYPLTLLVGVADEIHVSFSYNTALLEEETVAQISTRFSEVLGQMIGDELQLVSQISLITEDEQNQLLSSTQEVRKVDYPKEQTLVSLFEEQVVRTPLKIALVFEEHSMTYQELNQKANQLANLLRSKGVKPDSLVPICLERSLEMIVGILGILKAGGAYVPIDPLYPEDRIRFMIQDCNAGLVVTAQEGIVSLENEFEFINLSKDFESLEAFDTADLKPLAGPENLAYIIYTSGSTGKPKGVMIEHKNLVRLFKTDKPLFDFNDRDVWTMFHSFCFDFSVWEMYGALLYGGKLVIVPESCTKDTKVFAELVHHEQVTVLNQTPSAFQVLQEYMTSEFEEIPIRYVIFGGEALQPASLKTWNSSYPKCQLINMYGITETTVHVTYLALNTQHFQSNISSIGKPIPTLSVYVLDAYGNLQLPGIEGEMYVGGEGLARGYLNNPLLTEDRFITNPFNADERLYKTGDLAKWALDGSLEYLGRIDEQVKIRGFRIELGEIENTLLQFEEVSQAVVLAKADAFDVKRLVAYLVAKEEFEKDRAIEHLKQTLPDYMIPSFWVVLPEMPLTRNGKIDKKALPEVELAIQDGNESEEYLSETEHRLLKIWQELLGHKAIRTGSNFFEIGGHSLLAMRLMTALRREFDVEIRIKDIFSNPTLSELAKHIQAQNETLEVPLMLPVSDSETHIPLSFAQERLWFIDKLEGSRQFNLPIVLNLKGHIDANFLERCLNEIVNRHKVLRTVFVERNGEVVSELKPKNEWKLQRLSHADVSSQAIDSLILHPFDLSRDYMVRSNLLELSAEESVLVTVLHHIATDAWSNGVLVKEVMELYSAFTQGRTPDLKPLLLQYSDYAIWQRRYLQGDVLERKIAYWKQKLSETAFLDLPTDYVRPAQRGIAGAIEGFSIPIELSQSVNTLSKSIGTTLFMTLLSVYKVLLSKYSRQQDICVGTSIANRPQQELEELIGFFVNTLALRTELLEQDTFSGLLEKVKETTLEAYANQEVPFEKVVETVVKQRDPSRSPLFQVMLVLANTPEASRLKLGELELSRRGHKSKISKFDLTFHFNETPGGLQLSVEYSTDLFRSSTIHRMVDHFITLLTSITENPQQKLQDISIASTPEQTLLLTVFGQHIVTYPQDKTITELFEWQVAQTPDQTALTFENKKLTYLQLNQQANQLAHALIEQGVKPETLVPIYLNKGQGMIIAILGVLKAGGAYVPIDSEFPLSRVDYMLKDSGAKLLLSERALSKNLDSSIHKFNLDELDLNLQPTSNPQTKAKANSLAYVIYTSGSTGQPKGVMIEHGNLTDYVFGLKQNTPIGQCRNHALVSTIATDLGNTVIYGSLLSGGNLHVFSKETTSDPEALSNYFKQHQIDCLKIVPSHYKALSQQQPLLPQKLLIFGGEALKSEDILPIQQADPNLTIVNHYGPTETTIGKLLHTIEPNRVYGKTIPIGKPFSNTKVYVLDAQQHLSPIGVPGQLYIAGDGLARGYLNNEALTNEKFTLNPYNQTRMYATGDLVKYLEDGNLEYLGRIDQQVKIRGYRIELSEIERALNQIPSINQSVVIAKEDKQGNKQLLAYVVSSTQYDKQQTIQVLKQSLPDYMIPASITQIDEIPLTLNGKIDYKTLPDPEQSGQGGYSAPQDETEDRLAEIWQEILEVDQVGRNDDFFELGGHSLLAIRLISAVRKAFETEMPIGDIFDYPTIAQLKTRLNKSHAVLPAITPQPKAGPIPLSFSQERLWFIDKLEGSRQYHIPSVLRLKGELNIEALQNSIQQIVNRHEILRTTIQEIDGQGYQYIKAKDLWKLEQKLNVTQEQLPELVKQLIDKPFNLNADDMLRASLLELENTDHVLVVTLHHIASDGWSTSILVKELVKLYESYIHKQNPNLAALPVQYADYAIWQRTYLQGELLETKLDYWKDKLQGAAPLDLPTDYPRPALQSNKGAVSGFKTDKPLSDKLNELSKAKGTTLFMTLLAAFKVLLSRYSNQNDITVGTPMAGRQQQELEGLIGFFINTLALRDELNPEHSFDQLLQQVKTTTLEAYQHQDVPFEKVVEAVTQNRDLSRSPVFQVMFVFQNTPDIPQLQLGEVRLSRNAVEHITAQFDLRCTISDTERGMFISMEYCTDLFSQQTIERMNGHFAHLLEHIAQNPNAKLCDYELLAEQETHQLLTEFNATQTQYPEDKTILDLFAQQVNQSPNSTSVVYENQSLSFQELDEKSNQLANYLIELGVKPDSLVAICMERSLEMMVGILGILKANAAYVPIDPDYPQQRIDYMLEDCKASIILSHSEVKISLPNNVVNLDTDWKRINQQAKTKPATAPKPNHLAYVIYTSGSTGQPKGVMNEHSGLLNRLCWAQDYFKLTPKDKVLQKTTYSFDVSVWELLWPLISGAQLIFAKPGGHKDNVYLKEVIEKEQITMLHFVPSMLEVFLSDLPKEACASLKQVLCSGEALKASQVELFGQKLPQTKLFNLYGPTEAAIDVTCWEVEPNAETVPIGKPVANTQIYILNQQNQPVPIGVAGEIHIGGVQVARGYLNKAELTSEKFIPNPYSKTKTERLYKTGDLGKWTEDGNIECLGRLDDQVKIRGYRIELGEIETAIEQIKDVKQSAVLAKDDTQGNKRLVAYVVSRKAFDKSKAMTELQQKLPEYMVPQIWVELKELPLTPNGKTDRKALPEPDISEQLKDQYVAPRNETEQKLAEIWKEILKLEKIGIHDNFFELGGHSLMALRIISGIRRAFNVEIEIIELVQHPSIIELGQIIERAIAEVVKEQEQGKGLESKS